MHEDTPDKQSQERRYPVSLPVSSLFHKSQSSQCEKDRSGRGNDFTGSAGHEPCLLSDTQTPNCKSCITGSFCAHLTY